MSADTDRLIAQAREEWDALGLMSYHGSGGTPPIWYADLGESDITQIRALVLALAAALKDAETRIAVFEADSETDDWLSHRHNEEFKRAEAAEAQRDTFAEALREIAAMTEPQWDIGSARHVARAAFAGVAPPEEQP